MKKCPHCSELIQSDAKVCRYCGRKLYDSLAGGCLTFVGVAFIIIGLFWIPLLIAGILILILAYQIDR